MKRIENTLTQGSGKMRFILVIGMLFIGLMFGGTLEQTAFADGPGEPPETTTAPAPDQNIDSYLDQATEDSVNEMNPTFQGFVSEAWAFVMEIAPAEDWEEAIRDIIPQIHADAEEQNGLASYTGALTYSCSFTKYTTLGSSGWAAAVTSSTCTMDFLIAQVRIQYIGGAYDTNSCFNCRSVSAYVNGLACGYYVARGSHEWGNNPSGGGNSSDDGQAGC